MLTSIIAVIGTLAGAAITYLFAHLTARRAERVTRTERLRQEQIAAYTAFAGALTDLRRAVISLWFLRGRDAPKRRAAQTEADQRGAETDRARFAVRLLTDDEELRRLADAAFASIEPLGQADDLDELKTHEAANQEHVMMFIEAAGRQVR